MRAEEAYNKSLKSKIKSLENKIDNNSELDYAELGKILVDINKSASKGHMIEIYYGHGFNDYVIKALLDLGYRYFERSGVFGDFSVIITWDPNYSKGMDYEVTYKDLKI